MPDREEFLLDDDALAERFHQRHGVRDFVFGGSPVEVQQRFVLLGGQPAAGKSQAMAAIQQRYGPSMVPLTGDDLRPFHPRYSEINQLFPPEEAEAITGQASGAWVRMSIDYALQTGRSLLLEGVFRDRDMTMATANEFHQAGAVVDLVAVAVREERSRLDGLQRFLYPGTELPGRWTPPERHDLAYRMVPHTVAAGEANPAVSRILITNRTAVDLYVNERTADGLWVRPPAAVTELNAERTRALPPAEAAGWLTRQQDIILTMAARSLINDGTRSVLQRIVEDAEIVAPMADPDPFSEVRTNHAATRVLMRALASGAVPGPQSASALVLVPDDKLRAKARTWASAGWNVHAEVHRRRALTSTERAAEERVRQQYQEARDAWTTRLPIPSTRTVSTAGTGQVPLQSDPGPGASRATGEAQLGLRRGGPHRASGQDRG